MKGVKKLAFVGNGEVQENAIVIDWLTITFHDVSVLDVQRLLGLDVDIDWDDRLAFRHGYPRQCSFANIIIRHGADKVVNYKDTEKSTAAEKVRYDMGISLDMSGNGCRAFETYGHGDWLKLLSDICNLDTQVNFTRIDLAFDDHEGILDINRIRQDAEARYYTGSPKKCRVVWSDDQRKDIQGLTVYIGSQASAVYLRIYDKAAERDYHDRHWVRVEMVLRMDRALSAVAEILKLQDVGATFRGVLRNYCCFREPSNDSNKSRWPIAKYWEDLLEKAGRIRLWISPGEPYNFRKTEDHMIHQYGQAVQAFYEIHGNILDLLDLSRQAHPQLGKKYRVAINEAKLEQQRYAEALKALRLELGIYDEDEFPIITKQMDIAEVFGDVLKQK